MTAALALAVALPLVLASHWGILASAQIAASDLLFKTRASQPARSTVIIGIDQRSYRALLPEHGPLSQWPRTLYWQVVERAERIDAGVRERLARYEEGVELYRSRRFGEAEKRFAELAQEAPGDGPVALDLERSRLALVQPPPADWDGVHVAQIK